MAKKSRRRQVRPKKGNSNPGNTPSESAASGLECHKRGRGHVNENAIVNAGPRRTTDTDIGSEIEQGDSLMQPGRMEFARAEFPKNQSRPRFEYVIMKYCTACNVSSRDLELLHCKQCKSRLYCSKRCQAADWNDGHGVCCKRIAFVRRIFRALKKHQQPTTSLTADKVADVSRITGVHYGWKFWEDSFDHQRAETFANGLLELKKIKRIRKRVHNKTPHEKSRIFIEVLDWSVYQPFVSQFMYEYMFEEAPEVRQFLFGNSNFQAVIIRTIGCDILRMQDFHELGVIPSLYALTNMYFGAVCNATEDVPSPLIHFDGCFHAKLWPLQLEISYFCAREIFTRVVGNVSTKQVRGAVVPRTIGILESQMTLLWKRTFYLFCKKFKHLSFFILDQKDNEYLLKLLSLQGPHDSMKAFKPYVYGCVYLLWTGMSGYYGLQ